MKGALITIEGVEGSGKSTQIQLLAAYLRQQGLSVVVTREPGGTPLAERIRALLMECGEETISPLAELLLYQAARAQHVDVHIRPALERGDIVLCDRYFDSTTAYQGAGRSIEPAVIRQLNDLAARDAQPLRTFVLDLEAEEGLRRARLRGSDDRMMLETLDFHKRIRDAFLHLAKEEPHRITIVDGARSVELIQEELRAHVNEALIRRCE